MRRPWSSGANPARLEGMQRGCPLLSQLHAMHEQAVVWVRLGVT
jgi:hypothetical protein